MTDENKPVDGTETPVADTVAEPVKVEAEPIEAEKSEPKTEEQKAAEATEAAKVLQRHKQTASERVQQAITRQREAERRAERAEAEASDLRAKLKTPDPNQYDDNAKYTADLLAHQLDERDVSRADRVVKEATDEKLEAIKEAWQTRVADFKLEVPDFEEVVYNGNIGLSRETGILVGEMEDGPQVAYYLAKNAADARRIDRLPERAKAIELGKLAGKLSAPVPRKVTSAPEPIRSVGGKSSPHSINYDKMSPSDYAKLVAKETGRERQ